jgi:hypothetical protein
MPNSGSGIKPTGAEPSGSTTSYFSLINNLWLGYGLDDPGFESGMDNRFYLASKRSDRLRGQLSLLFNVYLWRFFGVKETKREANYSPPTSAI